jgi:hypothetical protein
MVRRICDTGNLTGFIYLTDSLNRANTRGGITDNNVLHISLFPQKQSRYSGIPLRMPEYPKLF